MLLRRQVQIPAQELASIGRRCPSVWGLGLRGYKPRGNESLRYPYNVFTRSSSLNGRGERLFRKEQCEVYRSP